MAEKEQKLEIYQGLLSCLFGEDEVRQCSFDQKRKIQGWLRSFQLISNFFTP